MRDILAPQGFILHVRMVAGHHQGDRRCRERMSGMSAESVTYRLCRPYKRSDGVNHHRCSFEVVIEELRTLFSRFGLPETIVSDNGTCFTSDEFRRFLKRNGVTQLLSAPYHPSSNGLAERAVQVVKRGLRKVTQGSLRSRLATVLFTYRLAPQSTTGLSPSQLLLGRHPRTRLDLLRPNVAERVERQQGKQVQQHNAQARDRTFEAGEQVFVRNYQQGESWVPGVIQDTTGPVLI